MEGKGGYDRGREGKGTSYLPFFSLRFRLNVFSAPVSKSTTNFVDRPKDFFVPVITPGVIG